MDDKKTLKLILAALGIVINMVFGTAVSSFKIPLLFLDTIGTIFVSVVLGPVYGVMTGGLTNVIQGVLFNPKNIPFAIVNIVIALIVGLIAKRYSFNYLTALITGLILSVVAPLVGTPIAVFLFSGLTGGGVDLLYAWLLHSGESIFQAAFIARITSNLVDKIASCLVVAFLVQRFDYQIRKRF
ncbi:energy-coupling factor transport system substrate-specific component [Orenia metallireducens]|uniref:Energy-coupling factor transport system substrate-specific component n=1 Tax=Orenia metallireducens TaxID=1413210 RepID=A0A285GG15_9FIRM|nr:CD3073 family putative ECF transporter S component [Orenia metallireducens]PRX30433.1 energy-coupling factor transport system substrate-specific component [Orenia metallireducens]SNY22519.1 energy-coupling factor transport system substrate-specific component [Orenia metallireducens]